MLLDWTDLVVHTGCLMLTLSYLSTRMVWLRGLAVCAIVCAILWFTVHGEAPAWMPLVWLSVLTAVNLVHLGEMAMPRLHARFDPDIRALAEGPFAGLGAESLERLSRVGFWRDLDDGHMLICEGLRVDAVHLLAAGSARVSVRGRSVATLQPGAFAGEMSFLSGDVASATVVVAGRARVFSLRQDALSRLMAEDAALRAAVQGRLGRDVATKLRTADATLAV